MAKMNSLPEGYRPCLTIDLQKNRKPALIINAAAVLVAVIVFLIGNHFVPIQVLFSLDNGLLDYTLRFVSMIVGSVVYMVLHELVHGVFMKYYGGAKPHYGFRGLYAYAGSEAYFDKMEYIVIALAPVIIWGVVLAVMNLFVTREWFWVVFYIQILNLSGATGDFYMTVRFLGMPEDILTRDTGTAMTVYSGLYTDGRS